MKQKLVVKNLCSASLKSVDFTIDKCSLNAIISKDFIDKVELLECISGLKEFQGEIILDGNVITKSCQHISLCKGVISLNDYSVIENVLEPLKNIGLDNNASKKKVYDLFKKADVENLMNKKIKELSYSEKKIISILKSIIIEPSLLLLEDPFTSLDLNYKEKLVNYLKEMKKTVVLFTTDNPEDLFIADNIIILKGGRVIANDKKEKVFQNDNLFIKNGVKMPFIIDLSHKLKSYQLIDEIFYNEKDLIDRIWN